MTSSICTEFRREWDELQSLALAPEKQEQLNLHQASCPACREFTQTLNSLKQAVDSSKMDPLLKRRLNIAVSKSQKPYAKKRITRWSWIVGPVAAAAAVATLIVVAQTPDPTNTPAQAVAISQAPKTDAPVSVPAVVQTTDDGRRFIEVFAGTALWLDQDVQVVTEVLNTHTARFRLSNGRVVAEIGAHKPGFRFVVATPDGEIEARGTLFSVEVSATEATRARVAEGTIEVRPEGAGLPFAVLTTGQEISLNSSVVASAVAVDLADDRCLALGECEEAKIATAIVQPETEKQATVPTRSKKNDQDIGSTTELAAQAIKERRFDEAKNLFDQVAAQKPRSDNTRDLLAKLARAYRRAKLFDPAADSYHRLINEFPGSEVATNGFVALAQIELKALGQADAALSHFEAYLQRTPKGYLCEAARAGRLRALNQLGRSTDILRASSDYLDSHPGGFFIAETLCYRGDANVRLNNCGAAISDYQKVIQSWPGSREAKHAAKGLGACGETP
jgi:ferric-dicitrate binding protein FerR (iron transport regulator)